MMSVSMTCPSGALDRSRAILTATLKNRRPRPLAAPLVAKGRPQQGAGDAIDAYRRILRQDGEHLLKVRYRFFVAYYGRFRLEELSVEPVPPASSCIDDIGVDDLPFWGPGRLP